MARSNPRADAARLAALLAALAVLVLAGCSAVSIRPASMSQRFEALDRSALDSSRPSERTLAFLKERDYTAQWESDPEGLVTRLDAKYQADPGLGTLFALMETTHLLARRFASDPVKAARYDLSCAVYAYLFLFDPRSAPPKGYLRPNTRVASEFYNRSVGRYLMFARKAGLRFQPEAELPGAASDLVLKERSNGLPFDPDEIADFRLAYEYSVSGLDVTYAVPGLGVPLIVERNPTPRDESRPEERYLPRIRQTLAATFFLRIATEPVTGPSGRMAYAARLEIHDPMRTSLIDVDGTTVPLESDTTTPLAYQAAHSPPPTPIRGLMDPDALKASEGLVMLQPYQKDKIPVVFVHGLISSPWTWLPMLNGLMGDPTLRERYQFWFFAYPTGNPVLYSAQNLRQSLDAARAALDPEGTNPAFNDMIIVGHSMGGLLTKAMVSDSDDALWSSFSKTPLHELDMAPDVRELLERTFFFKPLPYVTEVVFISTPHRGSGMALDTIGRIGSALVTLPLTVAKAGVALLNSLAKAGQHAPLAALPTGIDNLSPKSPVLLAQAALPVAVPFHSIIGDEKAAGRTGGSDGIVPYSSSHLEGAQTELIVKSGHGAHEHPLAIREVRRVMLEHLKKNVAAQ